MTTPDDLPAIRETILIDAGIDKVWRTMTSEATVPKWLGCMRFESRVGAVFFMQQDRAKALVGDVSGATHCEILALDAPKHFRFSWFVPNTPPTFISIRLEALSPLRTQVLFEHEGWEQYPVEMIRPIFEALSNGWKSSVLPALKHEAEIA